MHWYYSRKRIIHSLVLIEIILVVLSIGANISTFVFDHGFIYGLVPEFNLDKESNIPTIFSSLLLAGGAFLFYLNGRVRSSKDPKTSRKFKVLAGIFIFFSLDELSSLHELLIDPLRALGFSGAFHFSWVVVFIPLLLLLALYLLRFYLSLSRKLKLGLFAAGVLYVGGALGIELVGGMIASSRGEANLLYGLVTTVEETLEITGLVVLWNVLLKELTQQSSLSLSLEISD